MKKIIKKRQLEKLVLLIIAILASYFGLNDHEASMVEVLVNGTVTRVIDGDTIEVVSDESLKKVRLIGVDTPETKDPRKTVQCYGEQAYQFTTSTLEGKIIKMQSDPTQSDIDKYGRLLRYVYLEDGRLFNLMLIENGYAHEYTYNSNPYLKQGEFKSAEIIAEEENIGLWNSDVCP